MIPTLLFLCLLGYVSETQALRCYVCSFSSVDTDRSCLTITNDTTSVECSMTYCTIVRQEFIDPRGEIASFMRGCEASPDYLNHEIADSYYRTYYRACTSDLCNVGDGLQSITGGNLSPTPLYDGQNLLVPGTGAVGNLKINLFLIFVCLVLANFGLM